MSSRQQIINEITAYMQANGGSATSWYVGISSDARSRLFNDHNVYESGDAWIYRTAESATTTRAIEAYFLEVIGTDGGTGGGDSTAKQVYAYKKAPHTKP